mgnify:CR=1 FL=1
MYVVYILFSPSFRKHYTGHTDDLNRRLNEHNVTSEVGYTKRYRPWELLHSEQFETRSEAILREKFFKTGVGRDLIKKMIKEKFPMGI